MTSGKQMIENSDRGLTINKSLAWTIVSALVLAGVWVGIQTATMASGIEDLKEDLDKAVVQAATEADKRDRLAARVRALEAKSAARDASYAHLSRSLSDLQQQLGENNQLLRQLLQRTQSIPRH